MVDVLIKKTLVIDKVHSLDCAPKSPKKDCRISKDGLGKLNDVVLETLKAGAARARENGRVTIGPNDL
jgi:hypothetical protein